MLTIGANIFVCI